ncbi:myo-inositol 2-dehydrogenase-like [Babylonia areolata]|uniref:myo-inositol 2-dehydrogenase-like n=1 Tax=Babylonia areolata TaxID=304850 RepID=UPI003FD411F9
MTSSVMQRACRVLWSCGHGGSQPSSFLSPFSRTTITPPSLHHRLLPQPTPHATTTLLHHHHHHHHHHRHLSTTTPTTTNTNNNSQKSPPSRTVTSETAATETPLQEPKFQKFNVGAFGAGRIGRMHLWNICSHRRMKLQWVVEDNEDTRKIAKRELFLYDTPFVSTDGISELLEDSSLDGVFILTPTDTHASLITQALNRGKAVFVEKPTAETREEIEQCYSLAENKGVHLFTGFQRRLDPVMKDLYSAVRDRGAVGKVYNIKTVSRDSPKPSYDFLCNTDPDGCSMLTDMAVHDVDMIVWLTQGEVPELIYVVTHAHDEVLSEKGIDDSLTVLIKYRSGIIATIDSCRETTYGYDIRLEVFGSKGMVVAENPRETTSVLDGATGGSIRRLYHSFPQRFEKAFQLEVDHFVRCMEGTDTPPVTKSQALLTASIIEKGLQSFREKRPVYF